MPKRLLRLGRGARKDWSTTGNQPSDAPFVVYLGDGRYLGYAAHNYGVDVAFNRAAVFSTLESAEAGVYMAQNFLDYGGARVVPKSQVYR